jgi:hypothetical protein
VLIQNGVEQDHAPILDPQLQVGPWFQTREAAAAFIAQQGLIAVERPAYHRTVEIECVVGEPEWDEQSPGDGQPCSVLSVRRILEPDVVLAISTEGLHVCHPRTHQEHRRFVPSMPLPPTQVMAIGAQGQLVWLADGVIRRLDLMARRSEIIARKVPPADSLRVSDCGRYVMLLQDDGFAAGSLCVRSMKSGSTLWKTSKGTPVDSGRFSPSGRYVLLQWERPVQSGSEVLFAWIRETQTGRPVFDVQHTTWMESFFWGEADDTIVYGEWGSRPIQAYEVPSGEHVLVERVQAMTPIQDIPRHPPPARRRFTDLKS